MAIRSLLQGPRLNPTQVPLGPIAVDSYHPLAFGLAGAWLFRSGSPRNILTGSMPIAGVAPQGIATPYGPGAAYNGTTQYSQMPDGLATTGAAWTLAFLAQGFNGNGSTLYSEQDASIWPRNLLEIYYGNNVIFFMEDNATTSTNPAGGGTTTTWHLVVMTQTATNARTVYVDGASFLTDATTIQPLLPTTAAFGATIPSGGPGNFGAVSIAGGWSWKRALSAGEMALLQQQPFGLFRPVVRRTYLAPPAAAGPTVTADMWNQAPVQPYRGKTEMVPY